MNDLSRVPKIGYLIAHSGPINIGDHVTVYRLDDATRDREYQHAVWHERWRRDNAARAQRLAAAYSTLLEADPVTRAVTGLHDPIQQRGYSELTCAGCDTDGAEAEAPTWPCRTVTLLAETHGLDMTFNGREHGGDGPYVERTTP